MPTNTRSRKTGAASAKGEAKKGLEGGRGERDVELESKKTAHGKEVGSKPKQSHNIHKGQPTSVGDAGATSEGRGDVSADTTSDKWCRDPGTGKEKGPRVSTETTRTSVEEAEEARQDAFSMDRPLASEEGYIIEHYEPEVAICIAEYAAEVRAALTKFPEFTNFAQVKCNAAKDNREALPVIEDFLGTPPSMKMFCFALFTNAGYDVFIDEFPLDLTTQRYKDFTGEIQTPLQLMRLHECPAQVTYVGTNLVPVERQPTTTSGEARSTLGSQASGTQPRSSVSTEASSRASVATVQSVANSVAPTVVEVRANESTPKATAPQEVTLAPTAQAYSTATPATNAAPSPSGTTSQDQEMSEIREGLMNLGNSVSSLAQAVATQQRQIADQATSRSRSRQSRSRSRQLRSSSRTTVRATRTDSSDEGSENTVTMQSGLEALYDAWDSGPEDSSTNSDVRSSLPATIPRVMVQQATEMTKFAGDCEPWQAREWLKMLKMDAENRTPADAVRYFEMYMEKAAKDWFKLKKAKARRNQKRSLRYWMLQFFDQFCKDSSSSLWSAYMQAKQRKNEKLLQWAWRIDQLAVTARIPMASAEDQQSHWLRFLSGMHEGMIKTAVGAMPNRVVEKNYEQYNSLDLMYPTGRSPVTVEPVVPAPETGRQPAPVSAASRMKRRTTPAAFPVTEEVEAEVYTAVPQEMPKEEISDEVKLAIARSVYTFMKENPGVPIKADDFCTRCGRHRKSAECWIDMVCALCGGRGHPTERCIRKCPLCLDIPVVHRNGNDCPVSTFLRETPGQPLPEVLQRKMVPPSRRIPTAAARPGSGAPRSATAEHPLN